MYERERRLPRVTLPEPQEGFVGRKRAFVIDVSPGGFRVAQHEKPAVTDAPRKITFEWNGRQAAFVCELRWQHVAQNLGSAAFAQNVYHAGYRVIHGTAEAYDVVHSIMREYNSRRP